MGRLVKTNEYDRYLNGGNGGQNSQIRQNNGSSNISSQQSRQSVQNSSDNRGSEDRNGPNLHPSNQSFEQVWGNFNLSDDSSFFSPSQNNSFAR